MTGQNDIVPSKQNRTSHVKISGKKKRFESSKLKRTGHTLQAIGNKKVMGNDEVDRYGEQSNDVKYKRKKK